MSGNYDRIAHFYDVDMACNMPFDDVGFYAGVCAQQPGRTLELGCGNGRILLDLLARGVDAIGIDASQGMLRELHRKAAQRSLPAPVAQMDLRSLALRPGFRVVLCPYSLVTYLTRDEDVTQLFANVRALLEPGGLFVVDAFVPRPPAADDDFREDYRRAFGQHVLARWKRVVPLDATVNRIERRYRVIAADGAVVEQVEIAEDIRPFAPDELRARAAAAGFACEQVWWNYGAAKSESGAQFFTLAARAPAARTA